MPLQMRLPKIGFKSLNKTIYVPLNLGQLQAIADKHQLSTIDRDILLEKGYISRTDKVKVLAAGELTAKLNVSVNAISATAKEAIEKLGGSVQLV